MSTGTKHVVAHNEHVVSTDIKPALAYILSELEEGREPLLPDNMLFDRRPKQLTM